MTEQEQQTADAPLDSTQSFAEPDVDLPAIVESGEADTPDDLAVVRHIVAQQLQAKQQQNRS